MASSSSSLTSSTKKSFKYDVFLSFGGDTRKNFVDHLYHALHNKGIFTYTDDVKIEKGVMIGDELIKSIEDSRFIIVVFSKNYASSSWCLDELVKIMECRKTMGQTVYPVFYDVEPTEVRNQSGAVGEAFAIHNNQEEAGKWREALKEAGNLAGWELKSTFYGHEAKFIEKIVQQISLELHYINSSIDENLVGMENMINDVMPLLETGLDEVRVIGFKGMGGVGKTTLARAIFDKLAFQFEGASFVENVWEVSKSSLYGLKKLQEQILSDVLNKEGINLSSVHEGMQMMKRMMRGRKILLVLDDVDQIDQLEALAGELDWFKPGSRIIITTRDAQLLTAYKVKWIYDVKLLSDEESLTLFSRFAYGRDLPIEGYKELSLKVVRYAAGLPLTLKVLGSYLCGKSQREWLDALERLRMTSYINLEDDKPYQPLKETMEKLELSYINPGDEKYDVYLSFRGEDVRKSFIAHLYAALQRQGIRTFKDDHMTWRGRTLAAKHLKAIEDSRMFIIVFSKNYASSSWCLDQLVKIMECNKMIEHIVLPVFYDVDPSEVRKQSGAVGEAIDKVKMQKSAAKWIEALKEAARLPGWDLKYTANGNEAELIELILESISRCLRSTDLTIDDKNLIGMEARIKAVEPALKIGFDDVRMIGIKGLGGGGKTSLARAIYDSLSIQFQSKSFVDNVREVSKGSLTGLKSLQEKVLSDLLNDQGISVSSVRDGKKMMKRKLCGRKNLIVLDDVNHIDQLKALAGEPDWFGAGTRIIITTRDEHLLVSYGIDWIHNVNLLLDKEAFHLFSRHAFRREIPTQGFEELSKEVVSYAAGIPLIIEVLGSTLRGMKEFEWKDALERLKTIPLKEMLENLESSYESLEDDYKEIFLDVACFLKGKPKDDAIRILESCGFHARHGLRVLEQNSLITISEYGFLGMHDRIQDMGKYLVRSLHPNDPKRHSRLWKLEEIESIVAYDLGTEATKAIAVECPVKLCSEIVTKGFGSMKELKILCMVSEIVDDCDVKNDELSTSLPNELRFLRWVGYPHWSLPKTFQGNNLVTLEMPYSRIKCLWEQGERKVLAKLKFIDLNHTKLRTLDLGLIPNIETLNLTECHDLVELHMSVRCLKLRSLKISHSKLVTLDLGMTPNLELLELKNCHDFKELQMPFECLMLRFLDISHSKLSTFNIGLTPNLEKLTLKECHHLIELHIPIECPKLTSLKLCRSKLSIFDLRLTPNLEKLRLEECHELVELNMPVECLKLRSLNLGHSKLRTLDLGMTPNLEMLDLQDCYHLAELQTPIGCLKRLVFLNLSGCSIFDSFLFIKQLESLEVLCLTRLYLKEFPDVISRHLDNSLLEFRFRYNDIYELPSSIENLQRLVYLDLHSCRKLKVLPGSICRLRNLRNLKLYGCSLEELPEDIGQLIYLEKLNLSFTSIKRLPGSICMLKNLKTLNLSSCWNLEKLPEDIALLECLEKLILTECTQLRDVPDSICVLKELKYLSFLDCIQLQKLPEELGHLKRLEELNINGTRIRFLPPSVSLLTELKICGPKSGIRGIKLNDSASQIKDSEKASKAEGEHQFKKQRIS